MSDCATQTSDVEDDVILPSMVDGDAEVAEAFDESPRTMTSSNQHTSKSTSSNIPRIHVVDDQQSRSSRETSPGTDVEGNLAVYVSSRAATVAESSVCEDDELESMLGDEDGVLLDRDENDWSPDAYDARDVPEADVPRLRRSLRQQMADQEVDHQPQPELAAKRFQEEQAELVEDLPAGSETEADFLDRDGDFDGEGRLGDGQQTEELSTSFGSEEVPAAEEAVER
jgi:hypothetical protein